MRGEWRKPERYENVAGQEARIWGKIEGRIRSVNFRNIAPDNVRIDIAMDIDVYNGRYVERHCIELKEVRPEDIEVKKENPLASHPMCRCTIKSEEEKKMSKITVTKERIERLMKTAKFETSTVFGKCTIVAAQLENGFVLVESSACVDPANYDAAMGERICKDKIKERLWELEGYALQKGVYKLTKEMEA